MIGFITYFVHILKTNGKIYENNSNMCQKYFHVFVIVNITLYVERSLHCNNFMDRDIYSVNNMTIIKQSSCQS